MQPDGNVAEAVPSEQPFGHIPLLDNDKCWSVPAIV